MDKRIAIVNFKGKQYENVIYVAKDNVGRVYVENVAEVSSRIEVDRSEWKDLSFGWRK